MVSSKSRTAVSFVGPLHCRLAFSVGWPGEVASVAARRLRAVGYIDYMGAVEPKQDNCECCVLCFLKNGEGTRPQTQPGTQNTRKGEKKEESTGRAQCRAQPPQTRRREAGECTKIIGGGAKKSGAENSGLMVGARYAWARQQIAMKHAKHAASGAQKKPNGAAGMFPLPLRVPCQLQSLQPQLPTPLP